MAVGKTDLYRVSTDLRGGLCLYLWFVYWQKRRSRRHIPVRQRLLLFALIVTGRTGTVVPKERKIEMTGMTVGPHNIHASSRLHVDPHIFGLLPRINRFRHGYSVAVSIILVVAAFSRRNRIPVRTRSRMSEEAANALVQFRADDVFEFARLRMSLMLINSESVLEQPLRQS